MPAARVPAPTPSPDGLCQASSAASLTPQQLPGQGHARTQLARVPPSLGAAGVLRGTGGGGAVLPWRPHRDLMPLYMWWWGADWGSEDRAGGAKARTEEPPWVSFNPAALHQVHKLVAPGPPLFIQCLGQQRPWGASLVSPQNSLVASVLGQIRAESPGPGP